jgi:hypothetical protein
MAPHEPIEGGYYAEEARYFRQKPGVGEGYKFEVGPSMYRCSSGGIVLVKKVFKKASRARLAPMEHVGWEAIDCVSISHKSLPVTDELWAYLGRMKGGAEDYRHCDKCSVRLRDGQGYYLHLPKKGIQIQPPDEVVEIMLETKGTVEVCAWKKRYYICSSCIPDGWDYCRRCQSCHPPVLEQKAIAHLKDWLVGMKTRPLPSGRYSIGGIDWLHPGDSVPIIMGHISDALVCFPVVEEQVQFLDTNIKKLELIKEWDEGRINGR